MATFNYVTNTPGGKDKIDKGRWKENCRLIPLTNAARSRMVVVRGSKERKWGEVSQGVQGFH